MPSTAIPLVVPTLAFVFLSTNTPLEPGESRRLAFHNPHARALPREFGITWGWESIELLSIRLGFREMLYQRPIRGGIYAVPGVQPSRPNDDGGGGDHRAPDLRDVDQKKLKLWPVSWPLMARNESLEFELRNTSVSPTPVDCVLRIAAIN